MSKNSRFAFPNKALESLIDRYENGGGSMKIVAYPDPAAWKTLSEQEHFYQEMKRAEKAGAVELVYKKGADRNSIRHCRIKDVDRLYNFLGRTPSKNEVEKAIKFLNGEIGSLTTYVSHREELKDSWSRNKRWRSQEIKDHKDLPVLFRLAEALCERAKKLSSSNFVSDLDMRTFSRRVAGDSKVLERNLGFIVALAKPHFPIAIVEEGMDDRDVLNAIGIAKFTPPILISGPIGAIDQSGADYLGFPYENLLKQELASEPIAILSIENFVSFKRYVSECNQDKNVLVLYSGGFPSKGWLQVYKDIILKTNAKLYHWGDIDVGGLQIFRYLEKNASRSVRPYLMDGELLKAHGVVNSSIKVEQGRLEGSAVSELWNYIALCGLTLEQEELDPVPIY